MNSSDSQDKAAPEKAPSASVGEKTTPVPPQTTKKRVVKKTVARKKAAPTTAARRSKQSAGAGETPASQPDPYRSVGRVWPD